MKCEFCGADLSLEAEVCPHCGQLNKHAQQHIRDMKRYHGEFENTKKGVYSVTKKYTAVTVRIVIIAVLVVVTAILFFVYSEAYSIRGDIMRGLAGRNAEKYTQILDQYIVEEDFRELSLFCEEKYITYYSQEEYEKYAPVIRAAENYVWVCNSMMKLIDEDMNPESYLVETIGSNLNSFYGSMDFSRYEYYKDADREENVKALEAMEEEIEQMLQTYLGFTEEEISGLRGMSEAKRIVLIEEKLAKDE